jgi:3-carboxy-cis,cis-muconate cycloisomerase
VRKKPFSSIAENNDETTSMSLLDPLFRWDALEQLFTDRARVQGMLDFEAALARSEARVGVIPKSAAAPIASKCRAGLIDMPSLASAAARAGNLAIPLVKQLTELVAIEDVDAARYVHWGATSQDAIDTGFILQLRPALKKFEAEIDRLTDSLAALAKKHRATPVAARTWMQQALPTTFGFVVAGWLDAVLRHRERLHEAGERAIALQFGGAAGTLAALEDRGIEMANALGEELKLPVPDVSWHSRRDRVAEIAATLGLCTGTLGKIARDISLHTQTEIAEVFEPAGEGRGGSSTLPHKRNPVTCAVVLAAAIRVPALVSTILSAMVQEEERGLGGWHAEWETMPELIGLTGGALHHLAETIPGLEIDAEKMRENLELTHGLIFAEAVQMALAAPMGRSAAHEHVEAAAKLAVKEHRHLRDVVKSDPEIGKHLSAKEIDRLFNPADYLGVAGQLIDRVLKAHASRNLKSGLKGG